MQPVIHWFRRDLRLIDNIALHRAAATGRPVIPVYVSDSQDAGGASRWWLHHSLASLDRDLRARGSSLLLRSGPPEQVLSDLAGESGAEAIYFNRRYEPESRSQERRLQERAGEDLEIVACDDNLVCRPSDLRTLSDGYYRVFTPFWKASCARGEPAAPQPAPASLPASGDTLPSIPLDELGLLPGEPDWAGGLRDTWTPGEAAALRLLDELEPTLADYARHRDRPDIDATSRLSPYLHFGEVSARQVWHGARRLHALAGDLAGTEAFTRQLYWREFSAYLLFHHPQLPTRPLRPEFEYFPWLDDEESLRAWQKGKTGFPIVDAGMRQLWETGWMHNRVRMIVASFLVKDLMIPWQRGADWFLDTLVDADLANNSASWQWVAGCGSDAAPYFRVFNPDLQASKFDPDEAYVRRWIPELSGKSSEPYPDPIVDHREARRRALEAYDVVKAAASNPANAATDPA
ncbi:MAG: DNA photolyase family protein [Gammaproteobacteria bacterium]|nr:DNA photolyase family protein [Gammaproteobacteria bacterium]